MNLRFSTWALLAWLVAAIAEAQPTSDEVQRLLAEFRNEAGIELVFDRAQLPPAAYHDVMILLPGARQADALRIALNEARKYPRHFLSDISLTAIGIFDACASRQGDGFRPFDKELGGFRYYGIYNGTNAVAAAYYTDEQLPLTLHHEIFHHIDAATEAREASDRRWRQILTGENCYPAPRIEPADLKRLKQVSRGRVLKEG